MLCAVLRVRVSLTESAAQRRADGGGTLGGLRGDAHSGLARDGRHARQGGHSGEEG